MNYRNNLKKLTIDYTIQHYWNLSTVTLRYDRFGFSELVQTDKIEM